MLAKLAREKEAILLSSTTGASTIGSKAKIKTFGLRQMIGWIVGLESKNQRWIIFLRESDFGISNCGVADPDRHILNNDASNSCLMMFWMAALLEATTCLFFIFFFSFFFFFAFSLSKRKEDGFGRVVPRWQDSFGVAANRMIRVEMKTVRCLCQVGNGTTVDVTIPSRSHAKLYWIDES